MKRRTFLAGALVAALALALAASAGATSRKAAGTSLTGAGSTFVAPLVNVWINDFGPKAGMNITYGAIGSGGGIASITARTVDFGASDAPLTPDQMSACKGCVQIPWALSATAFFYNLPGVTAQLRITGKVIADIYLGKIKKWNDPAIKSLNPKVNLPNADITTVYRSDGSGTSYNVTDYLSKVNSDFASAVGKSTQPTFKVGIGARGSSGVAGVVAKTRGAIGYADIAYALQNHLRFFAVQNAAGKFQTPGIRAILAAAASVKSLPADNSVSIVNPPASAPLAYPCSTFTWIIAPTKSSNAKALKQFVLYAISAKGQALGRPLIFVPIPKVIAVAANKTIAKVQAG